MVKRDRFASRLDRAVGLRVAAVRRGMLGKLTQQALAERTDGLLSRSGVASIELGRQSIAVHQLYVLAQALGVEPAALLPPITEIEEKRQEPPDVEDWLQKIARPKGRGQTVRRGDAKRTTGRATSP